MRYNIGDIVWAKMRGMRALPGTVSAYSDINREICIEFFGKAESAWISERNVMLYTGHEQCGHFFLNKTTKRLSVAVNQANNFVLATAAENALSSSFNDANASNNSYQSDINLNDSCSNIIDSSTINHGFGYSNLALEAHISTHDEQCESNGTQLIMRSNVIAGLHSNETPSSESDCYANRHVRSLKNIQGRRPISSSILQMSSSNSGHLNCNVTNAVNNTDNTTNLKNVAREEKTSYMKYCELQ